MTTTDFVPVIDISQRTDARERARLAEAIGRACENSGFYVIVGHGIPGELIDTMFSVTESFFTLPDSEKDAVANRPGVSGLRRSVGTTANSLGQRTPPDLCETFGVHVTGDLDDAERENLGDYWASWKLANVWPRRPQEFEPTWRAYLYSVEELAEDLMRLSALALGLAENYYEDKFDNHVSSLVANYYYPQTQKPLPGQLRLGAHTDFGGLTVLYQETDRGGLQVRRGDDDWRDVPAIPGSFVVNIGDLMAMWTGGRWVSTMHRVVNPQDGDTASRISIPFFFQPNHDAVIAPLGETADQGVIAGEWMAAKMRKIVPADRG
ncbi:isopenicillin N synthase family dioxygenase [Stackebrandtia nassauensis]|uniref:2OG-Fe(II) oxygenase n=1 Tax=Stackebrandtia nassauensis (strain DSM 44728 / CIP 108903 / NRRL B-16338 / NBRC 102104 / LLR-40K-21) TaxID=446470 RepID=D3PWY1_STANL|nr:2OG-Fe(II) oxygenase family protein [Stackebrandtia nassauensis]ADD45205.1 2OG-Fe(II) oxygenase [Stackebrandtia nassauensis DSM 44728]